MLLIVQVIFFIFRTYTTQIIQIFLNTQLIPTTVTGRISRKETSATLTPVSQVQSYSPQYF